MEEDNENPYGISSGHVNKALIANFVYLNKKRKFQAEQLGLPLPKHKCCERTFSFESDSALNKNPEAEDFCTHRINGKTGGGTSDYGSETESATDSNSFAADSDSAMSVYGKAKFESKNTKSWINDQPSTSSANWGRSSFKNTLYCSDNRKMSSMGTGKEELICTSGGYDGGFQVHQNLEEQLLEFGSPVDYTYSKYGDNHNEQYTDREHEDMFYFNEENPNNFVLSSGRWSVNQEAKPGTRKPTIDQEFEQYFSTLML